MPSDPRSMLGLRDLGPERLESILDRAESLLPVVRDGVALPNPVRPAMVGLLFLENSTRTRCSFEVAANRLGHRSVVLTGLGSSLDKGESLIDTAANLAAMGLDALVIRSAIAGGADLVARNIGIPVVNAGDGRHEHPTQALLDASTLRARLGSLAGKRILIVGDILNSRVARSNIHALTAMGATVVLVGPPPLLPWTFAEFGSGVDVTHDLDGVLDTADAVMMLRIQLERDAGRAVASDYRFAFGLTVNRLARLGPEVPILHPGPMNRGVEIDDSVSADIARSAILEQVARGVAVRMAIIEAALELPAG
ncbi:MAG: aspartate carbamoyltransferase [Phycisphaeraceae bacterium TMED231]|nr:MAG: aspartate carbamoyltransferase [Phycisphaeraceae bacterium TMED231]